MAVKFRNLLASGVLALGCTLASAQTCEAVYANAVRNVDIDTRSLIELNDIYSTHCETNGSLRQSSAGLDLTVPVKAFKLGFSGSYADAKQEMQNFCKSYSQNYSRSESLYKISSTVVVDGLKAYNQCKALEINKVQVYHIATESRSVVVAVNFNPTTANVQLFGVNYDPSVAVCRSDVYGKGTAIVNESSGSVKASGPFAIACDRIAELTTTGEKKFPRFELLVNTSAGPYAIALPAEGVLGYDLATANQRLLEARAIRTNELYLKTLELQKQIENVQVTPYVMVQGEHAPIKCPQQGGNLDAYTTNMCVGGARTPLVLVSTRSGDKCGYNTYKFACYSFPK